MVQSSVRPTLPSVFQVIIACVREVIKVMLHALSAVSPLHQSPIKSSRYEGRLIGMPADIPDDLLCSICTVVGEPLHQFGRHYVCRVLEDCSASIL